MVFAAAACFILSFFLIPILIYISNKYQLLDMPTEKHKSHIKPVSNLGGLAISFSTSVVFIISSQILNNSDNVIRLNISIISPLIAIVILGLLDDLRPRSATFRLLVQTVIVIIGISMLDQYTEINIHLFNYTILNHIITIFFVLSVCNFVNMFDNHDGSASGVCLLILFMVSLIAYFNNQDVVFLLALCAVFSLLAFLIWNFPPAKIYLGDSGSTFLGTVIAILLIQIDFQERAPFLSVFVVLLILGTLELDFLIAVISRIRRGISPMVGDQAHISHRLKRMGLAKYQVTFVIWAITLWFLYLASLALWSRSFSLQGLVLLSGFTFFALMIFFLKKSDA